MAFSVTGRAAIVTGAGSGINLAFSKILLGKGCNVLFADIALRPESQEVLNQYPPDSKTQARAIFQQTDVTDWTQLQEMFDVAEKEFGEIDIVVPGAGVFEPHTSNFYIPPGDPVSKDLPDSGRYLTTDINLTHPIRVTQLAIAHFLNPVHGKKVSVSNPKRVLHISSIAAQVCTLFTPIYVANKAGISAFTRSLGPLEATLGIRVNAVAPGLIETPLWREHPEKLPLFDEKVDIWATAEEVAEAMLKCIESDDLPGGSILEVGSRQTRLVGKFNDPGPSGSGHTTSNKNFATDQVYGRLAQEGWGRAER